jgi:tetratricopeptide (TPR) repeat protein
MFQSAIRTRIRNFGAMTNQSNPTAVVLDDADAYNRRGSELAAQGLYDEAIEQYRKADELWEKAGSTDRKSALSNWGNALLIGGHYEQAAAKYRMAIALAPDDASLHDLLGLALAGQNRPDDAIEQYDKAIELWEKDASPNRGYALRGLGDVLLAKKLYVQATEKYRAAIAANPNDAGFHNQLGIVLEAQELFDDAVAQYGKAFELWEKDGSPERGDALRNLGGVLLAKKLYVQAAEKYRAAIAVNPNDAGFHNQLGVLLEAQELFDEAIAQYSKALELWEKESPDRKIVLRNLGDALRGKKLYDQAVEQYRMAIDADPTDPGSYAQLGLTLATQELFDEAIEQYRKADALWEKEGSPDRRAALIGWGDILRNQERFEDAVAKFAMAADVTPKDSMALFLYGASLGACARYRDAIEQFNKAALAKPDTHFPYYFKASYLFKLGNFAEGWEAWRNARKRCESTLSAGVRNRDESEVAVALADALRDIYADYAESERNYQRALAWKGDDTDAWVGLCVLYHQWVDLNDAPPEIRSRLSYMTRRADQLLREGLENTNGNRFQTFISLADLHIAAQDWTQAKTALDDAALNLSGSSLKRAEITERMGLICFETGDHAQAIRNFRDALLVRGEDLTLRANLGNALVRAEKFENAQDEFSRVLKAAPGHLTARLGAAQVCIELADDGDRDQYDLAERHLTAALEHGRNRESGSERLHANDIANIYYQRGYVRAKRYESDSLGGHFVTLVGALWDFRKSKQNDPNHAKAGAALDKIYRRLLMRARDSLTDWWGPLFVCAAGTTVFVLTQVDFFFQGTAIHAFFQLPAEKLIKNPTPYIAITFGSLLFMIAGLSLPKVLKLKVAGIELEKASVTDVSTSSSLNIGRASAISRHVRKSVN